MKRSAIVLTTALLVGLAGTAPANPPGDIDGRDIPSDFGGGNLLGTQANWTGWGDTFRVFPNQAGSELDGLYVGKDGGNLIIAVTGNLQTGGNTIVVFIDTNGVPGDGQNMLETQILAGPPYAVQNLGRRDYINTNGTSGDPSDDFYEADDTTNGDGVVFDEDFYPDYALSLNLSEGSGYLSLYELRETSDPVSEHYDNPSTQGDEDATIYAQHCYLGAIELDGGDNTLEGGGTDGQPVGACAAMIGSNGVHPALWSIAFNNTNTSGVIGAGDLPPDPQPGDQGDPATAITGLEVRVPFVELGMTGNETIGVQVLIASGGGTLSNQSLPGMDISYTENLHGEEDAGYPHFDFNTNGGADPVTVDLSAGTITTPPIIDGDITDTEYAPLTPNLQTAATSFGDQNGDPLESYIQHGSELNALYAASDASNLYLGITGNLEPGGNRFIVFIDSIPDAGSNALQTDQATDWTAVKGMHGDKLPVLDEVYTPVYYDYAIEMNIWEGTLYADLIDLTSNAADPKTWLGGFPVDAGTGEPSFIGDVFDPCLLIAMDNTNTSGVTQCDGFGEACFTNSVTTVQDAADAAITGLEMSIPLSLIGAEEAGYDGDIDVNVWVYLVNGGGYGSNQSLPTLRKLPPPPPEEFSSQNESAGDGPTDFSIAFSPAPDPLPRRDFAALTGPHAGPTDNELADCAAFDFEPDGDVDLVDFAVFQVCFPRTGNVEAACERGDYNRDGNIDLDDYALFQQRMFGPLATSVAIDTVTVGNPVNTADTRYETPGYGAVDYEYDIGKYEVTAGQYTAFLNAVAKTDTYGLYNTNGMPDPGDYRGCNIQRSGSPGSYTYGVAGDWANRPVNYVSWGDSARFANWLHNGQPTGAQGLSTTEDGSYYLNGAMSNAELLAIAREPDATWVIPSEDEWYKAAYHKNDGVTGNYWDYPTSSDSLPSNDLIDPDPGNNGNFHQGGFTIGSPYWRTGVGEFENSDSPYGTFDQGGNVLEWNEAADESYRGLRAGAFSYYEYYLHASYSIGLTPAYEYHDIGFRVSEVP